MTLFIQSLKQKNDWWSNEGQIVFHPADAVSDTLNPLQQNGWSKKFVSEDPMSYLSSDNLPLLPLSPKYTLEENFAVSGFNLSQGPTLSFVCSWNILWLSFYYAGVFLVLHYCWALALFLINVSAPQGISFSPSLNEQMLSLNEIWKYMVFLTKS